MALTGPEIQAPSLPIDAIQEFSTEQNPKAEDGWKEGSIVSVGIKSGTNSLHGTAYAFGRDASATDAANAFSRDRHTGYPRAIWGHGGWAHYQGQALLVCGLRGSA